MTRYDTARSQPQQHPRHAAPTSRRQPVQTPVVEDEFDDCFEDEDDEDVTTTPEPEPLVLSYWHNRFRTHETGDLPRAAASASAPQTIARPSARRRDQDEPVSEPPLRRVPAAEEDDAALDPRPVSRPVRRRRRSGVVYTLAGMLSMAGLVVGLTSLNTWWQGVQNDWHYGMPRTYQLDAVVGHHHDSAAHPTHLIALNLDGHVEIIEIAAGDPAAARVYPGPLLTGPNKDEVVVTLSVADVDHDGTPDLVVHVGESEFVLYNNGHADQFQSSPPTK